MSDVNHIYVSYINYEYYIHMMSEKSALHTGITWDERRGAGVETQKNIRGEIGGWGRVPFNETYAPSLSTIYDGA